MFRSGRVEDGRGSLGHSATLRFPSPLIEPDVRISRIRLSDWLHREAHETNHEPQASSARRALFLRLATQLRDALKSRHQRRRVGLRVGILCRRVGVVVCERPASENLHNCGLVQCNKVAMALASYSITSSASVSSVLGTVSPSRLRDSCSHLYWGRALISLWPKSPSLRESDRVSSRLVAQLQRRQYDLFADANAGIETLGDDVGEHLVERHSLTPCDMTREITGSRRSLSGACSVTCREIRRGRRPPSLPELTAAP